VGHSVGFIMTDPIARWVVRMGPEVMGLSIAATVFAVVLVVVFEG